MGRVKKLPLEALPPWRDRHKKEKEKKHAICARVDPGIYDEFLRLYKALQKRYGGSVTQAYMLEQAIEKYIKSRRRAEPDLEDDPAWTPIRGRRPKE